MQKDAFRSLFPVQYEDLWNLYKIHMQTFWTPEEISFQGDRAQWDTLNDNEKLFIHYVLAFFANSEALVGENIASRFYKEITIPEARCFMGWQIANEIVHYEAYALQIEEYTDSQEEKDELFAAIDNIPCIQRKTAWAEKWLNGKQNLLQRLLGFGLVEGLFFAGSFCAIYYFRQRGLLSGLAQSNDWITRDEGLHFTFSSQLFKKIQYAYHNNPEQLKSMLIDPALITGDIDQKTVEEVIEEAVAIEKEFIHDAIPVSLIGMNETLLIQYIKSRADDIMIMFGYKPMYMEKNPFEFMRAIDVPNVTNFFEKRVTDYQRPTNRSLVPDEDF